MKPIPRNLLSLAQLAVSHGIADQCGQCDELFEVQHAPLMPCFGETRANSKHRVCPNCVPALLAKQPPAASMRTRRSLILQINDDAARATSRSHALLTWKSAGLQRDPLLAEWISKTAGMSGPSLLQHLDHLLLIATPPASAPVETLPEPPANCSAPQPFWDVPPSFPSLAGTSLCPRI